MLYSKRFHRVFVVRLTLSVSLPLNVSLSVAFFYSFSVWFALPDDGVSILNRVQRVCFFLVCFVTYLCWHLMKINGFSNKWLRMNAFWIVCVRLVYVVGSCDVKKQNAFRQSFSESHWQYMARRSIVAHMIITKNDRNHRNTKWSNRKDMYKIETVPLCGLLDLSCIKMYENKVSIGNLVLYTWKWVEQTRVNDGGNGCVALPTIYFACEQIANGYVSGRLLIVGNWQIEMLLLRV